MAKTQHVTPRKKSKRANQTPINKVSKRPPAQIRDKSRQQRVSGVGDHKAKQPKPPTHLQEPKLIPLPLDANSKILLIGEGDFSFAACLATHHGCEHVIATTYESAETLKAKHPDSAEDNVNSVMSASPSNKVLYSIDGTKLGLPGVAGGSDLRKQIGSFDTVWFNFPHVGGKSTDVNRQVRANQALVVGFLEGAKRMVKPGGAVVVSLFEGMPYELWGIRNLARHVGLSVERSGRFEWERFPGYEHKRTLGDVEGGRGWKGEERDARVYIFRNGSVSTVAKTHKTNKEEHDDSDDEAD